jgi:hypothetical protein
VEDRAHVPQAGDGSHPFQEGDAVEARGGLGLGDARLDRLDRGPALGDRGLDIGQVPPLGERVDQVLDLTGETRDFAL